MKQEKKSIAVIGREDFTLGFKLAGIQKIFDTENYEQKTQDLVKRDDIGIVVAEQRDLDQLPSHIEQRVTGSVDPVVVPLSEEAEAMGLQDKIQKVIGIDLS